MRKFFVDNQVKMVSLQDRGFVFGLKHEELVQLLEDLGGNINGTTMVLKRRVMDLARHATEHQYQVMLGWRDMLDRDSAIFTRWIDANSPEDNREVMESVGVRVLENEKDNQSALKQYFRIAPAEVKKEWIQYAQDFCNSLLDQRSSPVEEEEDNPLPNGEDDGVAEGSRHEDADLRPNNRCSTRFDPAPERATLMDQVRKWNLRYSGNGNPQKAINFIDKVESMAKSYQITGSQLLVALPVLLQDKAETWHRCNRDEWQSWDVCKESFMLFFVPARMRDQMIEELKKCIHEMDSLSKTLLWSCKPL